MRVRRVVVEMVRLAALTGLFGVPLCAQDIVGNWQGTIKNPAAERRVVLQIASEADGGWKATLYRIDQGTEGFAASSVTLEGSTLKFTIDRNRQSFEGKVKANGTVIKGTWTDWLLASTETRTFPLELKRATKDTVWPTDPTGHTVQFIVVDNNVKLEVLDWGGSGRPVVLLTGQGNSAHVFDKFAPKLTSAYHVYGITRRGYGASSTPELTKENYAADRLGDDVLAVIDSLKLNQPVLVGHSLGGEELSSMGSRHSEKIAGLIYLDAGYSYAFYDRLAPRNLLESKKETGAVAARRPSQSFGRLPTPEPPTAAAHAQTTFPTVQEAIHAGMQKYTDIPVPILAIFAGSALWLQAKAFETGLPSARVVRLPDATHYVFQSNEADVLHEMNAFIDSLPSRPQ